MLENRTWATALAALLPLALPACVVDLHDGPAPAAEVAPQAADPCAAPREGRLGAVRSEGSVDVDITVGTSESVRLDCDPSLAPSVHVEAYGDALRIWNDDSSGAGGHCAVHVGLVSLRALDVSGSGDVRVRGRAVGLAAVAASGSGDVEIEELAVDAARLSTSGSADIRVHRASARSLEVAVSGSGDVRVGGASELVRIAVSGSGDVDARHLGAADVDVVASGSGDVVVNASRHARAVASGSGDVVVAGRPEAREASRMGSGSIAFE